MRTRPEVERETHLFNLHAAGKILTVSSGQGGSTEKNGENGNMGMDLGMTLFLLGGNSRRRGASLGSSMDGKCGKGFVAFLVSRCRLKIE